MGSELAESLDVGDNVSLKYLYHRSKLMLYMTAKMIYVIYQPFSEMVPEKQDPISCMR